MIDLKLIREKPALVRAAINSKCLPIDFDAVLSADRQYLDLQRQVEAARTERNILAVGMKGGRPDDATIAKARTIREYLGELERRLEVAKADFKTLYKKVPNLPTEDTPFGLSENENVVVRTWGEARVFTFAPRNHFEIASHHGWINREQAAKVAGSRFAYIKGELVKLQFALISWTINNLTDANFLQKIVDESHLSVSCKPFEPVLPPYMIRTSLYDAMDRLEPEDDRYKIEGDDLWLQGSAEHVLGSMHAEEIFEEVTMPVRYLGYATSFRKEAGAAGKDMEGIIRLHQFDKLEMESFSVKDSSHEEHLFFSAIQEKLMQLLNIPYQKVQKCTFDIGKPNAKGSDIDAWLPGQNKYRETHTADYMTDYQARRLNTRVRRTSGLIEHVHTNDATAFACGRALVAIMENYQNEDYSVTIPDELRPYMGGRKFIG